VKLFVIAGEPSGDRLGGALMSGLRDLAPGVRFDGIGGPQMEAQGLASRFPMAELSVMGLWEVLPRYRALQARIRETAAAIADARPDAVLTIDSPDFCLRVLRRACAANPRLRTIHYVAPSVWAWRPGRATKMAPLVDHVLALLPFEPPFMQAAGMSCDFVGHPVVSEPQASQAETSAFRTAHAIAPEAPLILTLPGSRRGEIARLAPRFEATLRLVLQDHPTARVVVPTVADQAATLRDALRDWPGTPLLLTPEHGPQAKRAAFAAADAALAASGTVSLELAASATPMVIGYDFNPLTRAVVARMLQVDTVTLVNLVSETRAIPEFLGKDCRPAPMAQALSRLLTDPKARAIQHAAMKLTMARLGKGGDPPGLRAARSVFDHLSK